MVMDGSLDDTVIGLAHMARPKNAEILIMWYHDHVVVFQSLLLSNEIQTVPFVS